MSYVAYFKGDHEDARRPITFLFNGAGFLDRVAAHGPSAQARDHRKRFAQPARRIG